MLLKLLHWCHKRPETVRRPAVEAFKISLDRLQTSMNMIKD